MELDDDNSTSTAPPAGLTEARTSNSSVTTSSAVSHISSTSSAGGGGRPNLHSFASQDGRKTICDGRFVVLETLGTGATGKVKLGIDTGTGERVALKIMGKRPTSRRQSDQNQREITAMTSLSHPNVLKLLYYDYNLKYPKSDGTFKDCVLLVIDLAQGGELFDFMMYTGSFEERIAKAYTRQLLSALVTCHTNAIYHRDLKPENLLLDAEYNLKVADFGYSAIQEGWEEGKLLHTECGTRSYMAPEILAHQPYEGRLTDTWSAGVVIFIMITGNPPFQLATRSDWWFNALATGNVDRFWRAHMRSAPNISAEARDFLERMLKPEASDRATLRELLEHEWLQDGGVPDDELYAVMDDKKRRVDAAKSEERVKERARQKAAKAQGQQFDPFREQHKVRRGVATNDESVDGLPKAGVAGKAVHTRLYLPEEFGAGKQGDRVARILSQLQSSLTDLGCTDIASAKGKLKATLAVKDDAVGVSLKLFVDDGSVVAEVSRKSGDIFAFRKAFTQIKGAVEGSQEQGEEEDDLKEVDEEGELDMI